MNQLAPPEQKKTKVLLVDTLSATNDFGVELPIALDPEVELTVFTIKGTRLKQGDCARIVEAFPEYWGTRGKFAKLIDQLKASWMLAMELIKHRRGVVHIQFFRSPALEVPIYILFRPILRSLVFTAHNAVPHEQKPWHRLAYQMWYAMMDKVHVLSRYTAKQLSLTLGVSPKKIVFTPHGNYDRFIDDTPPAPRELTRQQLGIADQEKLILYFGLIRPYKGVDRLVSAVSHMAMPNLKVLITGGCAEPLLSELRQKIAEEDGARRIIFRPGFVENHQLSSYLAAADIVVFPYTHIYQSGAVLLAMSFGKSVIASDIEGFREYVQNGRTGWLTDTTDANTFASAIESAALDEASLIDIGQAARHACDTEFSWRRIAETISLELYQGRA